MKFTRVYIVKEMHFYLSVGGSNGVCILFIVLCKFYGRMIAVPFDDTFEQLPKTTVPCDNFRNYTLNRTTKKKGVCEKKLRTAECFKSVAKDFIIF